MQKSREQRITEREVKVKFLEKQKAQFENQNDISDSKAIVFDMIIDMKKKGV